jgi:hypothetical protein
MDVTTNWQAGGWSMATNVGDRIVIESEKVGIAERRGEILEVIQHETRAEYRVRWDDGHESGIRPYAGSFRIEAGAATSGGAKSASGKSRR